MINGVTFDGINSKAGVINAGTGGLQVDAKVDVINQGQMASAGHAVVAAGRDFVQNADTAQIGGGTTMAALTGMLMGVHALARVLANSEAFREQSEVEQDAPPEQLPLGRSITGGLFAALCFLSEQRHEVAEELLDSRTESVETS